MADNPIDINSIPFGNIIGGPLAACVMAQADAAQTTRNYINQALMKPSDLSPGAFSPKAISFSFSIDGKMNKMIVPLLTIVPIPYMRIDNINLSFTAEVTESSENSLVARYTTPLRTQGREDTTTTEYMSIINVDVHASTSDVPSGVAKLLEVFSGQLIKVDTISPAQGNAEGPMIKPATPGDVSTTPGPVTTPATPGGASTKPKPVTTPATPGGVSTKPKPGSKTPSGGKKKRKK